MLDSIYNNIKAIYLPIILTASPTGLIVMQSQGGCIDEAIGIIVDLLNDGKQEWQGIKAEMCKICTSLKGLKENHEKLTSRVFQIEDWSRKAFPPSTVKTFTAVVEKYFKGTCPCCGENPILNGAGVKNGNFEVDHFKGPKWNKITEGWAICSSCHSRLTYGYLSRDGGMAEMAFKGFQMRVKQYQSYSEDNGQKTMF